MLALATATPMSVASTWDGSTGNWNDASHWISPANVPDTATESAIFNGGDCSYPGGPAIGTLSLLGPVTLRVPGTLNVTTWNWTAGYFTSDGISIGMSTVYGNATLTAGSSNLNLQRRWINLYGTTTYSSTGTGFLNLSDIGQIDNNGTFNIASDSKIQASDSGSVTNHSLFQKTAGTGTSTVDNFANAGTVIAKSGTLQLNLKYNSTNTGTFTANSGARLVLNAGDTGTRTLASAFNGDGTIEFTKGEFVASGTFNSTAKQNVLTGFTALTGTFNFSAADFRSARTPAGSVVTVNGDAQFGNSTGFQQTGSILNLKGNTVYYGNGIGVYQRNDSTINNSGTLKLNGKGDFNSNGAGTNTFFNTGLIVNALNYSVNDHADVYNLINTGTVRADAGVLNLHFGGSATTAGAYATATGTTLQFDTSTAVHTFTSAVTVSGQGTFKFPSQVFTLNGPVRADGGTFDVADIKPGGLPDLIINGTVTDGTGTTPSAGLTKTGAGTLRLTGDNSYRGPTILSNGRIIATTPAFRLYFGNGGVEFGNIGTRFQFDYAGDDDPIGRIGPIVGGGYASKFKTGQFRLAASFNISSNKIALGYGDDTVNGVATIMCTYYGDADLNGLVNFNDFLVIQNNFGQYGRGWQGGDFNYDGRTDFNDFLSLQNNFGSGSVTPLNLTEAAAMSAFAASVPEPSVLALAAVLPVATMRRRRRASSATR